MVVRFSAEWQSEPKCSLIIIWTNKTVKATCIHFYGSTLLLYATIISLIYFLGLLRNIWDKVGISIKHNDNSVKSSKKNKFWTKNALGYSENFIMIVTKPLRLCLGKINRKCLSIANGFGLLHSYRFNLYFEHRMKNVCYETVGQNPRHCTSIILKSMLLYSVCVLQLVQHVI